MKNDEISRLMEDYSQSSTEEKKHELVNATAAYVFSNLKCILAKSYPADEDARSEFMLWIYPQLSRIVERFDASKASFPTYVSVGIKYRYIRFCAERARHAEIRVAAENEETRFCDGYNVEDKDKSLCACESAAPYGVPARSKSAKKRITRDVLLLALKSAFYLSEELIEKVSAFCEIPREDFESLLERVRGDYGKRQGAYEELRFRKYRYYLRAFSCRKKLNSSQAECSALGARKHAITERELEFCNKQAERLKLRMDKMKKNPSNRYLATLLGMPRGSVNSALARIKKRLYSSSHGNSIGNI